MIESPRVPQERFARNNHTPRLLYFVKGFRAVTMSYIFLTLTATLLFRARKRYTFFSIPDSKCSFFVFAAVIRMLRLPLVTCLRAFAAACFIFSRAWLWLCFPALFASGSDWFLQESAGNCHLVITPRVFSLFPVRRATFDSVRHSKSVLISIGSTKGCVLYRHAS